MVLASQAYLLFYSLNPSPSPAASASPQLIRKPDGTFRYSLNPSPPFPTPIASASSSTDLPAPTLPVEPLVYLADGSLAVDLPLQAALLSSLSPSPLSRAQSHLDTALAASAAPTAADRGGNRGVLEPVTEPEPAHDPIASPNLNNTLGPIAESAFESDFEPIEPDPCDDSVSPLQSSVLIASGPAITPPMPILTRAPHPPFTTSPLPLTAANLESLLQDLDDPDLQGALPDEPTTTCCVCGSAEGPLLHSVSHDGQPFVVCTRAGLPLPFLGSHSRDNCESCISVIRETTCDFSSLVFSVRPSPSSPDLVALRCITTGSSDIDSLVITESPSSRPVVHRSVAGDSPALPLVLSGSINASFLLWPPLHHSLAPPILACNLPTWLVLHRLLPAFGLRSHLLRQSLVLTLVPPLLIIHLTLAYRGRLGSNLRPLSLPNWTTL